MVCCHVGPTAVRQYGNTAVWATIDDSSLVTRHSSLVTSIMDLLQAPGIRAVGSRRLLQALDLVRKHGVDIADALLAVDAARAGDTVCSLDRDFEKLLCLGSHRPLSESRVSIPDGGDP